MNTLIPPEAERRTFGSLTRADRFADAWYDEPGFGIVSGQISHIRFEFFENGDYVSVRFNGQLGGLSGMNPDDELWVLRRPADFAPPSILERVPFNDAVHAA